ncbi:MAG: hypothetical protein ABI855_05565 [Bacteroidota bacterium]
MQIKSIGRISERTFVPLSKIEAIRNTVITLEGMLIPIGKSYEENFFSVFKK